MTQPKSGNYVISGPIQIPFQDDQGSEFGRPSVSQIPQKIARVADFPNKSGTVEQRGHKRSNTIGGLSEKIFGRNVSFFGSKSLQSSQEKAQEKQKKSYPPVSMSGGIGGDNPRQSIDSSRRSISFGFGRKRSGSIAGSGGTSSQKESRRFSLLPASFSLKSIGIGKDYGSPGVPPDDQYYDEHADNTGAYLEPPIQGGQGRSASRGTLENAAVINTYDRSRDSPVQQDRRAQSAATPPQQRRYIYQGQTYDRQMMGSSMSQQGPPNFRRQGPATPSQSDGSLHYQNHAQSQITGQYTQGFHDYDSEDQRQTNSRGGRGVLQKNNRKLAEAYEQEPNYGYGGSRLNSGSSGAARKVMDFFRRRGKAREGDDR
jgi:protein-serine/threonine kinase